MHRTSCLVAIVLVGTVFATPAVALTTRYVAPDGRNQGNNCANVNNPCRTVRWAIRVADEGDVIQIEAGTYTSSSQPLTIDKSLWLVGEGRDRTRLQAHAQTGQADHRLITILPGVEVVIGNLTIRNGKGDSSSGGGIHISKSTLTLVGARFRGNQTDGHGCSTASSGRWPAGKRRAASHVRRLEQGVERSPITLAPRAEELGDSVTRLCVIGAGCVMGVCHDARFRC
ncbi:MAG: DUF1565 domain-containing protein [Luteitalea sp.]|nr:DUF1565 domain-containing protein [Luteitalea sp.]